MSEEPFELPPEIAGRIPLFAELSKVLSWRGGPVNWDLARQLAVAVAASEEPAQRVAPGVEKEWREASRVAELWLAEATGLPAPPHLADVHVLTAPGWAEHATSALRELVDPLAARVSRAVSEQPLPGAEEGEGAALAQALRQMAPLFLGIQAGIVIGALSTDVLGGYDLPLPVADEGAVAIVAPAVDAFASEFGLDPGETRLWVATHESAHRIEFEALPWVRPHFFALYHDYVAALQFDLSGVMERLQQMDLSDPQRLQEAMGEEGLFGLVDSPATQRSLERIHWLIALLEAFADRAAAAAAVRLPSATAIAEAARRRGAEGGKGRRLFQRFIGLEVPPERRRAAEVFTGTVLSAGGWEGLNRLWDETENLPSAEEIAAPETWLRRIGKG